MQNYFRENPQEKLEVIRTIQENSIKIVKPSVGYLPSYLVHDDHKENVVKSAIEESYFKAKKKNAGFISRKREKISKMREERKARRGVMNNDEDNNRKEEIDEEDHGHDNSE